MIDSEYFDMIINKKFLFSDDFYKNLIEYWITNSKNEFETMLIYSDDLTRTKINLTEGISKAYNYIRFVNIKREKEYYMHDNFYVELSANIIDKNKKLRIIIQSIEKIQLSERGCRLTGLIIDIYDPYKEMIDKYLENHIVTTKLIPFVARTTELDQNSKIGLVLYH